MTRTASLIVIRCKAKLLQPWNSIFNTAMTCIMKHKDGNLLQHRNQNSILMK